MPGTITVPVKLTARSFRDFAIFDTLARQRKWVMPVVFCLLLSFFAGVCYAMRDRGRGAMALVAVLLVVGIGLPVVYFASFLNSIRQQNRRMGLSEPKEIYTVTLDADGVHVDAGDQHMDHTWASLYRAYRRPDAVYLYPSPKQAYLLPYADTDAQALWALIDSHLPNDKLFDRARR